MEEIGTTLFGFGNFETDPNTKFKDAVTRFEEAVARLTGAPVPDTIAGAGTGALSLTGKALSDAFTAVKDKGVEVFDSLKTWSSGLALATGGYVSGPGSGTSDSIPAMLSNGEYVINAQSAAKFKPLLDKINGGNIGHFFEGGEVGGSFGTMSDFGTGGVNDAMSMNLIGGLTNSLTAMTDGFGGLSNGFMSLADAQIDFGRISANVIGDGFADVGKGMFGMGQLMQQGFISVGLAMVNSQKPGKFNWVGAAMTIAGAAYGAYSSYASGLAGSSTQSLSQRLTATNINSAGLGGFATGGYVSGPGSATSDSIAAMLSNGEYVINAASTAKFKPLLDQINTGTFPRFATGGAVGTIGSVPAIESAVQSSESKATVQHVFNINITGDISRQTRKEIHSMLPTIASGVNMYNAEKGVGRN
jgi:hypothetical protein